MRITCLLIFFVVALCGHIEAKSFAFPEKHVEVDLINKVIKFSDFSFGKWSVTGSFSFNIQKEDGLLTCLLSGNDIVAVGRKWPWMKMLFVAKSNGVELRYFDSPDFVAKGNFNLADKKVKLNVLFDFYYRSQRLKGNFNGKATAWGTFDNILVNGDLIIKDGFYKGKEFSKFTINFLGKPPILNLTDSKIHLKSGSVYSIEGVMDLDDFGDLFPEAEYVSKKVYLGGWQLHSEGEDKAGFKKDIDEKFDFIFDTSEENEGNYQAGSELRYKMQNNQFLKFRLQEDRTIVGFEKKREF
ncbi:MAG: hypothetical protein GY858_05290 [Candidatus Omnitrophica bacterium]|nr:hypothetical protein [Candidatus Omnitrophota bacterium]